jgi:glycosyltransferase involved in cell wall biosynthesis
MRLLLVHNRYKQFGGEDAIFDFESSLLERNGHNVHRLLVTNDKISGIRASFNAAWHLPWNRAGYALVTEAIKRFRPDIIHVHNFFPLLSPSIYDAALAKHIPVVQTLHNFRITCANGQFLRNGSPCELCIHGNPYYGALFRCYRNSFAGSLAVARMINTNRLNGTWRTKVARFIALSWFSRSRFLAAGLPADRVVVKPNGSPDYGKKKQIGSDFIFVGRLSEEKGLQTLLDAARRVAFRIKIIGDGPLRPALERMALPNVCILGQLPHCQVISHIADARCLVLPSICYENFPMTLVEAYSVGVPVIGSRIGSLSELIEDGITGLHFEPKNSVQLEVALNRIATDDVLVSRMGDAARTNYNERFTPDKIYAQLLDIYESLNSEGNVRAHA